MTDPLVAEPPGRPTVPAVPAAGVTRVVLVRHGEAECNVNGVIGGPKGCTGLTPRGVAQVRALADRLAETGELSGVAAVYSSDLPRAIESARILEPVLRRWAADPGCFEVVTTPELVELRPGEADGLTWEEFQARFGEVGSEDPDTAPAPGAESWNGFVDRAAGAVARLAEAHPDQLIVLVCHAGVVESTFVRFFPLAPAVTGLGLHTEHASLTEWARPEGRWVLRRYNDVARLADEGPPAGG